MSQEDATLAGEERPPAKSRLPLILGGLALLVAGGTPRGRQGSAAMLDVSTTLRTRLCAALRSAFSAPSTLSRTMDSSACRLPVW